MTDANKWAAALAELERQIEAARIRVERLALAADICRDRMEHGAPFSVAGFEIPAGRPDSHHETRTR